MQRKMDLHLRTILGHLSKLGRRMRPRDLFNGPLRSIYRLHYRNAKQRDPRQQRRNNVSRCHPVRHLLRHHRNQLHHQPILRNGDNHHGRSNVLPLHPRIKRHAHNQRPHHSKRNERRRLLLRQRKPHDRSQLNDHLSIHGKAKHH